MQRPRSCRSILASAALAAAALLPADLLAQCTTTWDLGPGSPGPMGPVEVVEAWDPDGSGPNPAVFVAGGSFALSGKVLTNNIAVFTPSTQGWSALGSGLPGRVRAIAGNRGTLAAAHAVNSVQHQVSVWNGAGWTSLGNATGLVARLGWTTSGDLIACGDFFSIGGTFANGIARWNGTSWSPIGGGVPFSRRVSALAVLANDDLVIGGDFTSVGGGASPFAALWDGALWQPLGGGPTSPVVDLAVFFNGDIYACTDANGVERWDGTAWSPVAGGPTTTGVAHALLAPTGELLFSGSFVLGARWVSMASFDQVTWNIVPGTRETVIGDMAALPTGEILVATAYPAGPGVPGAVMNGAPVGSTAQWRSSGWGATGTGCNAPVLAITPSGAGDVLVAGDFTMTPNGAQSGVARFNGTNWTSLGTGIRGSVRAVVELDDGSVVAAGTFSAAGGAPAKSVARFAAGTWSPLGTTNDRFVLGMAKAGNGQPVVVGSLDQGVSGWFPSVATWSGSSWTELPMLNHVASAVVVLGNGDIVVGGAFTDTAAGTAGGLARVARWNGSTWSALGAGFDGDVYALCVLPNGDLVAGGSFSASGTTTTLSVARFDGSNWLPLGSGLNAPTFPIVQALLALPGGDLVAAGTFTVASGVATSRIARFNGAAWAAVDQGMDGDVHALALSPSGKLLAGGMFARAGGRHSAHIATLSTSCPAAAPSFGQAPCVSAVLGGPLTLIAHDLPWLGTACRTSCPAAANAVAIAVWGTAPTAIPLTTLDPAGVPGCQLVATPHATLTLLASGGRFTATTNVPNLTALLGQAWFHQITQWAIGSGPGFAEVCGSNGLQLTFGSF